MEYEEFRKDWLQKHRSSMPIKQAKFSGVWGLLGWILASLCAAVVSGAHTVPTVYGLLSSEMSIEVRWLIAICGFGSIELLIYMAAFYHNRGRIVRITQVLALSVAIVANVYLALTAATNPLQQAAAIILGIVFPLIVYCAGEMSARTIADRDRKNEAIENIYKEEYKELEAKILSAYTKQHRTEVSENFSEISVKETETNEISVVGYRQLLKWFDENNETKENFISGTIRNKEISEITGASPVTVSRVKKHYEKIQ